MNIIEKYFTHLTDEQKKQIAALDELYRDWNNKINVISRKDIDLPFSFLNANSNSLMEPARRFACAMRWLLPLA